MANAKFWDRAAAKYAKDPIKDIEDYTYTLGRTRSYLGPDSRVLEIGCGTGSTALELSGSAKVIVATDISAEMLGIAQKKADDGGITNVTFRRAEAADAAAGDQFDVVTAHSILHLVDDLDQTLAMVLAALPKGGLFIAKTPSLPKGPRIFARLMLLVIPVMQLFGKAPRVSLITTTALIDTIEAAGFEIIETHISKSPPIERLYSVARKR